MEVIIGAGGAIRNAMPDALAITSVSDTQTPLLAIFLALMPLPPYGRYHHWRGRDH